MGKSDYAHQQLTVFDDTGHISDRVHNTRLVDYGILQEESNYRVHVGGQAQQVHVFTTLGAKKLVRYIQETNKYKRLPVTSYVDNMRPIVTAVGYAIPLSDFVDLQSIPIPRSIFDKYRIHKGDSTGHQGYKAVCIVYAMLEQGAIPLSVSSHDVTELSMQISGTDIIIDGNLKIQVKYDHRAGSKRDGGSGNIFIQLAECNPLQQY